jgi:predicted ATPase/HPt (histidine-containing phosphotransfer) domain-containing protein
MFDRCLYQGNSTRVYAGLRESDGLPVVGKSLAEGGRDLREEYALLQRLRGPGLVEAIELHESDDGPVLVQRLFGTENLAQALEARGALPTRLALQIGQQLAQVLMRVHGARVLHRDIKPENVLFDATTGAVALADFGIAAELPIGARTLAVRDLVGTASYVSPEQTGRTRDGCDARSDLYSLGITLYQLVTGSLPFRSTELLELVSAHLSQVPELPTQRSPAVPPVLGAIIMKLLAKSPSERYQSARGLHRDLTRCLSTMMPDGQISEFALGLSDLRMPAPPEHLFGRESEQQQLARCYEEVRQGTPRLVLISGREGSGRRALTRALIRDLPAGLAGEASFQREGERPLSALSDALSNLAGRLLLLEDESLAKVRHNLAAQLGQVGQVVVDLAPALGDVLGPQPELPELGLAEQRARLRYATRSLLAGVAHEQAGLLALHDFQHADPASLSLVEAVLAEGGCRTLVVLSAVDATSFGALAQHPAAVSLELGALDVSSVVRWVAGALSLDAARVGELATLLHEKSAGNPGLLLNLLEHFVEQGVIDRVDGAFTWSLEAVRAEKAPPTLAARLAERVRELPKELLDILAAVASDDHPTALAALSAMLGEGHEQVSRVLRALEREGLVVDTPDGFTVAHPAIGAAATAAVPAERVAAMVARLALHLLRETPEGELAAAAFRVAKALSLATPELGGEERLRAAKLYALAGAQVTRGMGYQVAAGFFERGAALLTAADAENQRALAFELAIGRGRSLMMLGQNDHAEDVFKALCARELTPAELGVVYPSRCDNRGVVSDRAGAIALGLEGLARLGIKLAAHPSALRPLPALFRNEHKLSRLSDDDHVQRPVATDARAVAALRILSTLTTPVFLSRRNNLYLLVVETAIGLILKYGHVRQTASFLGAHSTVVLGGLKRHAKARRSYEAAMALDRVRPAPELYGRLALVLYYPLHPWFGAWRQSAEELTKAVQRSVEVGDPLFAALCGAGATTLHAMSGLPMDRLSAVLETLASASHADRDASITLANSHNLAGKMARGESLLQADLDRITNVPLEAAALRSDPMVNFGLALTVCGHEQQVRAWLDEIRPSYEKVSFALPQIAFLWLLDGLFAAKDARNGRSKRLRVTVQTIALLRKLQTETRTRHHEAAIALLEAEVARAKGELERASGLYARASATARTLELVQLVAYTMEQRAEMLVQLGLVDEAAHFFREAVSAYRRWGHLTKVRALEQAHPELRALERARTDITQSSDRRTLATHGTPASASLSHATQGNARLTGTLPLTTVSRSINETLDLQTVLKISQEISTQLHGSGVVRSVLSGIAENAGADRVLFVLRSPDGKETAYGELAGGRYRELGVPIEHYADAPSSLLKLLRRTRKPIVVADALTDPAHATDPFVQASKCRSVAGIPILKQGELSGFVVLENRLAPGAFTASLIGLTQALVSQAAISLDNASLYEDMESRVRERTAALHARNAELRLVLDNVVQGLAIVDLQGKLAPESSAILHTWFPEGLPKTLVGLFAADPKAEFLLQSGWEQLLDGFLPPELCIDQLPKRLHKGERVLDVSWEPIENDDGQMTRMMVVLSDVTEVLRGQEAEAEQRQQMALFQRLSTDRTGVLEFVGEASNIVREVQGATHGAEVERRLVHTLKGNAGFFGLGGLMTLCHELESTLIEEQRTLTPDERARIGHTWSAIIQRLQPFIEVGSDVLQVRKADYEAALRALLREGSVVAEDLQLWQLEPLEARFERIAEQTRELADRLGKGPVQVRVQPGGVRVPPEQWAPFWSAFVHAVRNAIDHGIEPAWEREELGKGIATITLRASHTGSAFVIELSDDGRGIAWEKVRAKADERGLPSATHEDLVAALFSDGISTKDAADELSGRGVGMGALKDACSAMKGKVSVESREGGGTTWRFSFPSSVAKQSRDRKTSLRPAAQHG